MSDGIALLCACISNLAECVARACSSAAASAGWLMTCRGRHACRRAEPPKAFISTHFHEVVDEALVPRTPALKYHTMNILATVHHAKPPADAAGGAEPSSARQGGAPSAAAGGDDIVFLYRLVPGHAAASYGIHCARMAGVPAEVLSRAADILEATHAGEPLRATRHDPRLAARNARCTRLVQALIDFDVDAGDVRAFLEMVRAVSAEEYEEDEHTAAGGTPEQAHEEERPREGDDSAADASA